MKCLLLLAMAAVSALSAAQFTEGNLVASVVGDGGDQTDNQPVVLRELTVTGASVGSDFSLNGINGRNVTTTYGETSEGQVSRSGNGLFLTVCGYDLAPHSTAIFSTFDTLRVVARISNGKAITFSGNFTVYDPVTFKGDGVRGAYSRTGRDFIVTGGDAGLTVGTFGGPINQYFAGDYSSRSVSYNGGQYVYNGSNAYFGGNGLATWDGNPAHAPVPLFPSAAGSSREFHFLNPTTCYVTTSTGAVGLVKYVLLNGEWTEAYRLGGTGVNSLAVDASGPNPILYVTTSNGNSINKTTDNGTAFAAWTTIASAATGTRFRGLDWAPTLYETVYADSIITTVGSDFGGDLASLGASDDNAFSAFNDDQSLVCTMLATATATAPSVSELRTIIESSVGRVGLALNVELKNFNTNSFSSIGGGTAAVSDVTNELVLTTTAANFVSSAGSIQTRLTWSPVNDEDPAQDGWLHSVDVLKWRVKP